MRRVVRREGGGIVLLMDRYLTFRTDAKGRTVIPAALRAQAGIREDGDVLVGHVEDGRLIVETRTAVRRRLREQAAACQAEGVVDRLRADREADLELDREHRRGRDRA
jgi:bifunctional DNA-binding transcriptional regulator/antitoxin component of YhaV-PrlF toxin-antitoxin module